MCIFNGAFALVWVGGLARRPRQIRFWSSLQSLTDTDLSVSAETRRCSCGADSEEKNEKHLWGESCWFDCLPGSLAEDEYCMVPAQGGWWLLRVWVPPHLPVAVSVSSCIPLSLSPTTSKLIQQILSTLFACENAECPHFKFVFAKIFVHCVKLEMSEKWGKKVSTSSCFGW